MRIVHLVAGDLKAGAARGALNLHYGLLRQSINSKLLTNSYKDINEANSYSICFNIFLKLRSRLKNKLSRLPINLYRSRANHLFNTGFLGENILSNNYFLSSDIIHMHWVNGLISLPLIRRIEKPIIWTIRDMWPFTGGCHYAIDCNRYQSECGSCPHLNSSNDFDLSRLVFLAKKNYYNRNIQFIGISNWITNCAKKSKLLGNYNIKTIYNSIDSSEFFNISKIYSRKKLKLPCNKKIILIGAQNLANKYKGFDLFLKSLKYLQGHNYHLVIFGNTESLKEKIIIPYTRLGVLRNVSELRLAYSAADVYVFPSVMEAFGKTVIESMSCKTPVVCFDKTGPAEIIDHKISGFKSIPFRPSSLAHGIDWVLSLDEVQRSRIEKSCRDRVVKAFDNKIISEEYLRIYKEILNKHS